MTPLAADCVCYFPGCDRHEAAEEVRPVWLDDDVADALRHWYESAGFTEAEDAAAAYVTIHEFGLRDRFVREAADIRTSTETILVRSWQTMNVTRLRCGTGRNVNRDDRYRCVEAVGSVAGSTIRWWHSPKCVNVSDGPVSGSSRSVQRIRTGHRRCRFRGVAMIGCCSIASLGAVLRLCSARSGGGSSTCSCRHERTRSTSRCVETHRRLPRQVSVVPV
jgi:hypothetical protein